MKTANVEFLHKKKEETQAEVPDENLLYACEAGELESLGLLFERHRDTVYRFLSRLSGTNEQDLDDLVQTTFLELKRSARTFRGRSSVKSWILGIAANVARHHIRGEVRQRKLMGAYGKISNETMSSPQKSAEHSELLRRLAGEIDKLPYKLRVVFVLCSMEGMSGTEAAQVLGLRPGTVRRRLHESRKRLRRAFEWSEK